MPTGNEEALGLPVRPKAFANAILLRSWRAKINISPMKLQKLLFFCHSEFLLHFSRPLITQQFEAWDYGPVDPDIYREFKEFGSRPILRLATAFDPVANEVFIPFLDGKVLHRFESQLLKSSFKKYAALTAEELSEISHSHTGPWRQARSLYSNGLGFGRRITDCMIMDCGKVNT